MSPGLGVGRDTLITVTAMPDGDPSARAAAIASAVILSVAIGGVVVEMTRLNLVAIGAGDIGGMIVGLGPNRNFENGVSNPNVYVGTHDGRQSFIGVSVIVLIVICVIMSNGTSVLDISNPINVAKINPRRR